MLSMSLGIYPILRGLHFIDDLRPIFGHSEMESDREEPVPESTNWLERLDKTYLQKIFRKENLIEAST